MRNKKTPSARENIYAVNYERLKEAVAEYGISVVESPLSSVYGGSDLMQFNTVTYNDSKNTDSRVENLRKQEAKYGDALSTLITIMGLEEKYLPVDDWFSWNSGRERFVDDVLAAKKHLVAEANAKRNEEILKSLRGETK